MGISCVQKILDYVVDVRTTVLVGSTDFRELFKLRCVNKEFQAAFVPTKLAVPDQPNYELLAFVRLLPKMIPLLQTESLVNRPIPTMARPPRSAEGR